MYCALFVIYWIKIYQNEIVSFEDFVLEKQANYAADSAIDEILAASDINTDYADGDFITLEPRLAVRDFATTLCIDFGLIPTEVNIERVMNKSIRTMAVCAYDGIYAHYLMQTETNTWELKQTPKIPYFYTSSDGTQYCLTLDPDKGYWDYTEDGRYQLHKYDKYDKKPSEDLQATAINDKVADVLNWGLQQTYGVYGKTSQTIEIPAIGETVRGEQPVQTPTVIAVVEGHRKVFSTSLVAECIGGAQLEDPDLVVGFDLVNCPIYSYLDPVTGLTYGGDEALKHYGQPTFKVVTTVTGKFYAKSSWWKKHVYIKDNYIKPGVSGQYFDTDYEAAKAGYNDLNLMN